MAGPNTNATGSLPYTGVNAPNPPNFSTHRRAPTANDWKNFSVGDLWENIDRTSATFKNVWMLVSVSGPNGNTPHTAVWSLISAGGGDLTSLTADDNLTALPDGLGQIKIAGDPNITTNAATANQVQVTLNQSVTISGVYTSTNGQVVVFGDGNNSGLIQSIVTSNGSTGAFFILNKSRLGGIITSGDTLGTISFRGFDGAVYKPSSQIISNTSGTIALNRIPANLEFYTNPDSVAGPQQRLVISSAGNVTINQSDSGDALTVNGNIALPAFNATGSQGVIKSGGVDAFTTDGVANVWAGLQNPPYSTLTGVNNIVFGGASLSALTTGFGNVIYGGGTGLAATTASDNHVFAGGGLAALTTGNSNLALGHQSGLNLLTGSNNIFIGTGSAGSAYVGAESSSILIENTGVVGESNVIRIGTTGGGASQQNKCWIAAIRGVTTDVNDAVAVLIDSTGQLGTTSSSIRFKENVHDLGVISEDIYKLRPVVFNYIHHATQSKSVGLIAEEVDKIIPSLVVKNKEGQPETIKYQDLPVMILNELQKLCKRVEKLERRIQ